MSDENNEELNEELELDSAEEELASEAPADVKPRKADASSKTPAKKKVRKKNRVARWFREMKSELKKVVWPTPKQITNNTLVSLVVMVAAAVVIWAVDQIGAQIFSAFIKLGG
ncbi:MAG: preprotein translocase subunit SecE [Oscillospiraceae bacterium]|jgi:preprotein translocase subunit SecE|nr:preprotein translocase subunit SecE [Oscillospiraceae bacterium]